WRELPRRFRPRGARAETGKLRPSASASAHPCRVAQAVQPPGSWGCDSSGGRSRLEFSLVLLRPAVYRPTPWASIERHTMLSVQKIVLRRCFSDTALPPYTHTQARLAPRRQI